ncbi:MAG: hypothetical protein U9Q15_03990 [Patescibacteria group bacterium]|nr:hypothetical protein [Patescibacteria group bacterium]
MAVVLIIYAGARRIWSVWNEKEVEASTTTLQNAIIGLIAALFAVPVIRAITAVFEDIGLTDISEGKPTEAVQNTIGAWIQQVLFPVLGPLAVIGVLWVAYRYLFAMGDSGKIESANKSLSAILVGIVIVLFAYAIVSFLTSLSLG